MSNSRIVNERFFSVARENGPRPAIGYREGSAWRQWSYRELANRSSQLADYLNVLGVLRGEAVGIVATRHPDTVAAMIGILEIGAHYLPLDPAYPEERLRILCREAGLKLILSANPFPEMQCFPLEVEVLEKLQAADSKVFNVTRERSRNSPATPAYIMFTSGSTGVPKGVVVPHRAIVRLVDQPNFMRLDASRVFLHLSPLSFDASTLEVWGPLLNGGLCVLYPDQQIPTAAGLKTVIRDAGVNSMWLTASLFNSVIDQDARSLEGLDELLVGGEALSVPHVTKAIANLPGTQLINGYGPTENTTFTTCYRIPVGFSDTERRVPVGIPISGTHVAIVDDQLKAVSAGAEGELVAIGDGLALGYLNKPDLTAERFVQITGTDGMPVRGYRTGDRVVQRPDGLIDYLGRFDDQVKIDGHRIEPGEIERTIMQLPGIRDCRVLVRTGPAGQKRLAAYMATAPDDALRSTLRQELGARLPAFMVPHYMFYLDVLPTNANGKLDKDALPDPFKPATPFNFERETGDVGLVKQSWQEILNRPPVSEDLNFFDAGGTSLEAVALQELVSKKCGRDLEATFVFEYPTIRRQVEALNAMKCAAANVVGRGQQRRSANARRGRGGNA
ncbi:MAG: non-ribosomal peptide synthetase [Burkholderiales bacterium]